MLIIICGLPGTGKTSLAKALAERRRARHLNTDGIRMAMGKRGRYDRKNKDLVYRNLLNRTEDLLKKGYEIILDGTFYTKANREPFIQLAENLHTPCYWIELKAQESTIKERIQFQRPDSEADFNVYQKIKHQYEPILIPHLTLFSDQIPMEKMLIKIEKYLQEANKL